MPNLNIRLGRLKLDNPIIVAPGHITRTFENIERADRYGAGAISIKTTLLEGEYSQVVEPYERDYPFKDSH